MRKIGVDLGGTNIRACLIDDKKIIKIEKIHLENKNDLNSTLQQLITLIESIYDPQVAGIGIGVPSVVDLENGIVYNVVNIPSWKEVHLKDILEKQFGVPTYINNDSNCFALGEKHFGAGKAYNNMVGITLGTGIGSGVIIQNDLYVGANCGAGEIGYLPYLDQDLEYYCSSMFFSKKHGTTAFQVFNRAEENDPIALSLWEEFGKHLGVALKSVMYAYDPELIVIGGSITGAYKYFEGEMHETLSQTHFPNSVKNLKICLSETENVSMLGAAALVQQQEETSIPVAPVVKD